jgi:SAM-dependent methyltransferase
LRQQSGVDLAALIKRHIKAGRRRGAMWVRVVDVVRHLLSSEGRARLWTRFVHRREVHQTSPDTSEERYPELFDFAARVMPNAARILSFGCSTGEELAALRRRFPVAEIVGVEINPRSRRIAARRMKADQRSTVVAPGGLVGSFDLVFALAVLQREPHKIEETSVEDLTPYYPFARFDAAVRLLAGIVRPGGLLCVANTHYRVEDSSSATILSVLAKSPVTPGPLFGPDGRRMSSAAAGTIFQRN